MSASMSGFGTMAAAVGVPQPALSMPSLSGGWPTALSSLGAAAVEALSAAFTDAQRLYALEGIGPSSPGDLREQATVPGTSLRQRTAWVVSAALLLVGVPLMNVLTRPSLATTVCGAFLLAFYVAMSLAMTRLLKISRWIALALPLFPGVGILASILLIGKVAFFERRPTGKPVA